ncbi:MAG: alpha-amylase [Anaerolineae bacterium]|nr:alpha-amylase [Anaerolineae bacterium]
MSALLRVIQRLEATQRPLSTPYMVPGLWNDSTTAHALQVDPYWFYRHKLSEIMAFEPQPLIQGTGGGEWTRNAIIYNLFPRVTTAFDHNSDGRLEIAPTPDGWRETGTLLKCIALLPYIHSMGFNVIHLLPIMSVGQDNKKGTLGSPYSIRNLYNLDPNLDEPALGLTVDDLFAAFVEAAHRLGIRVVMEFVLRLAARDADWICEHPDWFYWIKADVPDRASATASTRSVTKLLNTFGPPQYNQDTLNLIRHKINTGDHYDLPAPSPHYKSMFTQAPHPDHIKLENGRYIGTLEDGTRVRIPSAFSDWHFDDNQPPWTDATYFRMYTHPDFNYVAYNTLRIYDTRLAQPDWVNRDLWDALIGVIPHYQTTFGIDGVMIDMGHALPMTLKQSIVAAAREVNSDFAFWDENFGITHQSRQEGYNAVMGYWMLAAHHGDDLRGMIKDISNYVHPVHFFAAPENHNTPRAASRLGGTTYSHYALAMAITTPGLPFILSGFELGETQPINTGLGFSAEQMEKYPVDKLPLFSEWQFNWTRHDNLVKSVTVALGIRKRYEWLFTDPDPATFSIGSSDNPTFVVFLRKKDDTCICIIGNADPLNEQRGRAILGAQSQRVPGLWGTGDAGMDLFKEAVAHVGLSPAYVLIVDGHEVVL